jgi:transcriptional regulator of acetoin/glycerol metabolism
VVSIQVTDMSIAKAWARCRDEYKLDPAADPQREHIGSTALRRRIDELAAFQSISEAEMHRLFGQLAQSRHVLVLADASGVVLNVLSAPGHTDMLARLGLAPGFVWDERHEGANGPGTCLHDRQPVVVHRDDHFFSKNRGMTCSAVPVWGANGSLLGSFDISSLDNRDSRDSHLPMLALAGMSARIIEHLHFMNSFQNCMILRLHQRRELVGLPSDSLLAIDEAGQIRAVDSTVPDLFGLTTHDELIGRALEDVLGLSAEHCLAHAVMQPAGILTVPPRNAQHQDKTQGAPCLYAPRLYASVSPPKALRQKRLEKRLEKRLGIHAASGNMTLAKNDAKRRLRLDAAQCQDTAMARNFWYLERVVDKKIHILLQGETGTGKDSFARRIHQASARHDMPFVAVSCAALPETLIEAELFGYAPGAFTGARGAGRRGKILTADGGTLFLDEIGDMPLTAQARLLRVLEEKEISPLGSDRTLAVDVRIISATHQDLPALVARGAFRMDLYYRLNGVTLQMPALRDRGDRGDLIRCIATEENEGDAMDFEPDAWLALSTHQWPGNIRELRNVLRMAVALADGEPVGLRHLPPLFQAAINAAAPVSAIISPLPATNLPSNIASAGSMASDAMALSERGRLLQMLTEQHWRIGATATALGISRNTLYRKLHVHGLKVKEKS